MKNGIIAMYKEMRNNMEAEYNTIFNKAVTMAESVDTLPSMPRITTRQVHRSNAAASDPMPYYRVNLAIPFVEHIIENSLFSLDLAVKSTEAMGLVPTVLLDYSSPPSSTRIIEEANSNDLHSSELLDMEVSMWKAKFPGLEPADVPSTSKQSISCMPPVTSCECERRLRRLNIYTRASMTDERLSSLAHIHIASRPFG
ncbi:52 kDa repressor of the inhibitor of the protein kinase-like [Apostichopus japonicus]|uniref:52 kDa repressor of the inhibitor of the protein kinase-like n=1 Tax=Stichopus japonicus TaxID=307972 RepID=UPI003AB4058E